MGPVEDFDAAIENIEQDKFKYKFRQFLVASAGVLWGFMVGVMFGYSSIIFMQLRQNNEFTFTVDEEGWIASVLALAMIPGKLPIGWILETYGRRYAAIAVELINLVGLVATYYGTTYYALIAGRVLSGIYIGLSAPVYLSYIGEIASPKYRAFFMSLTSFGTSVGVLVIQLLGYYVQWNYLALIFAFVPIYNSATFCYAKESFVWYINRNDLQQAKEAFIWFRGTSSASKEEFCEAIEENDDEQTWNLLSVLPILKERAFLLPFLITNLISLTNQFSGSGATLAAYTAGILDSITNNADYQFYANIVLNVFGIFASILASFLTRLLSVRRIILVNTYILVAILLNLSLFMYLLTKYPGNQVLTILALLSVIAIVLFSSLGVGGMESVVSSEVYPASFRGIGCSLSTAMSSLYAFTSVKIAPGMFGALGGAGGYLLYGCITLTGTTIIYFVLPNTQNKTLKEIELMFTKKDDT